MATTPPVRDVAAFNKIGPGCKLSANAAKA